MPPESAETGATLSKIAERIRSGLRARTGAAMPVPPPNSLPPAAASEASGGIPPQQIAKLAHELRTPIAAITAMAEIMRDERFGPLADARYRDYARSIHDSARHMLQVIESMLDRAATGADTPPLTFVDLDVNALTADAVDSIRPLAAEARLTLETRLAERLPMVVADQRCVRQILLNLLTNALKFTPAGGLVTVATRYLSEGRLIIEVADSGRGMAAAELARVAGKMSPPAATTGGQRKGGGYGLGLPLVHALAAANGASIEISSTPDAGTQARLIFPSERIILV